MGIAASAEEIPNDEIWYEASAKLTETTIIYTCTKLRLHFMTKVITFAIL